MIYNPKKRKLEKIAGIIGIINAILVIACSCVSFVFGIEVLLILALVGKGSSWGAALMIGLILIVFSVLTIIFSSIILIPPVRRDGSLRNKQPVRICLLIFSFLSIAWITFGLEIAVMKQKDYIEEEKKEIPALENETNEKEVN